MKKPILFITILIMLFSFAACGKKNDQPMTGGWTVADSADITDEARGVFEQAMEGLVGVNYEPIAFLGSQVVSGTNRCFLCEASVVYPGARPYYAVVTVYTDLQGNSSILNIVALDLGKTLENGAIAAADSTEAPPLGGWTVDRDPGVHADGAVMHLASQIVSGKNHCELCKGWTLTFIYENLEGKTEILKTVPLDLAALAQPEKT